MKMIMNGSLLLLLVGASVLVSQPHMSHALSSAVTTTPTPTTTPTTLALQDFDYHKNDRLPWMQDGYNTWEWNGHKINYLEMGGSTTTTTKDKEKPALLLIHGFGASAYHFRYNIPVLARDYHVYAFDLLGFGLSDKPLVDYSAEIWRDQATAFVEEVIGRETTVAGNSLGGFTALYTAASSMEKSRQKDETSLINGCVLLNGAGRFRNPDAPLVEEEPNAIVEAIKGAIQRLVIGASFIYTKQPARIEQVLRQVYPVNADVVDSELVESIQYPSFDPNAAEVFYRVITKNGGGPGVCIDDLLQQMNGCPLLLCWGEEDPWIRPAAADKIQALYPAAQRVSIDAGHCPHDEDAPAVNTAIKNFMESL